MKKIINFTLIFSICIGSHIYAQTNKQSSNKKKIYTDSTGNHYFNRTQPIYLWISSNPDSKEMHLLKSESSKKYTNPLYLDQEGKNTIKISKKKPFKAKESTTSEIIFDVYADSEPPKISASITGINKYTTNKNTYYAKNIDLKLSAKDELSKVKTIFYSINKTNYTEYKTNIQLNEEKQYNIKYYAIDNVGNTSKSFEKTFTIDNAHPTSKTVLNNDNDGNIVSLRTTITLKSKDNLSGIKNIKYSLNNKPEQYYLKPISLRHLKDGEYNLVFYATDNVDNVEPKENNNIFNFYLDNKLPQASASITGHQFKEKYLYISKNSLINIEGNDSKSSIKEIKYGINTTVLNTKYIAPFKPINKYGIQSIYYSAVDKVNNISKKQKINIFLDNTPPISGIKFDGQQFLNDDIAYIRKSTLINIFQRDKGSGIAKTEYTIDNDNYKVYSKFSVDSSGIHIIKFRSTDNVNNIEIPKLKKVIVDETAPEIFIHYSIISVKNAMVDGVEYPVYPTKTKVFMGATDSGAGVDNVFFSINKGKLTTFDNVASHSGSFTVTQEKTYTVKVLAKDKVGNESTKIAKIVVTK